MAVKLIADAMLGRLARWLRLFGFDTLYIPDVPDAEVLRAARSEDRLILTRDTGLGTRAMERAILISSEDVFEQIAQVVRLLGAGGGAMRCPNCNGELHEVRSKEDVAGEVPEHVLYRHSNFMKCSSCGRVYWEGSQHRDFKRRIQDIINNAKKNEA